MFLEHQISVPSRVSCAVEIAKLINTKACSEVIEEQDGFK